MSSMARVYAGDRPVNGLGAAGRGYLLRIMLALLLYLWLGPRAAFAELMAEILIGTALLGGGRGKLVGATLRLLLTRLRGRRAVPA
jgi:hypothetical protein